MAEKVHLLDAQVAEGKMTLASTRKGFQKEIQRIARTLHSIYVGANTTTTR